MEQALNPYKKLYGKALTDTELRQAEDNLLGFVSLLLEVDQENKIICSHELARGAEE